MHEGTYSPPLYLDLYNFHDGAQNDIFENSTVTQPSNASALPAGVSSTPIQSGNLAVATTSQTSSSSLPSNGMQTPSSGPYSSPASSVPAAAPQSQSPAPSYGSMPDCASPTQASEAANASSSSSSSSSASASASAEPGSVAGSNSHHKHRPSHHHQGHSDECSCHQGAPQQ